jgi:hypothetical protein
LIGWASALAAGFTSVPALAQAPVPPTGPVPVMADQQCGPIRRAVRHVCFTIKDKFIGYPDLFAEPPLGFYTYEAFALQEAHAEAHNFTLYRSDFINDSTTLSPIGAQRLSLMSARLSCWLGPVTVEWTPDKPGLADSRRTALVALLQNAGLPIVPDRILVGPSPYPGTMGADAANNFGNMIVRGQQAAQIYSVTPTSTSQFGGGNR